MSAAHRTPLTLARIATLVAVPAVLVATAATPALAQTVVRNDGEDPGVGYTPLQAILIFVVIPIAVILLTALAVYAPSWTRSGRSSATFADGPVALASPAAATVGPAGSGAAITGGQPNPTDGDGDDKRGGSSARW